MNCPGCQAPMEQKVFDGNYGTRVTLDLCHACTAIWFDNRESLQLAPSGTLQVFKEIGAKLAPSRQQFPAEMHCPRCQGALAETQDIQRATRFSYFRCTADNGHFITFFQFLREKNFVRGLDAKQVAELREHVKVVNCSNCGAPVDLDKAAACPYCRAPISTLDSVQIQAAVDQLKAADQGKKQVDATLALKLLQDKMRADAALPDLPRRYGQGSLGILGDAVEAVAAAIFSVF